VDPVAEARQEQQLISNVSVVQELQDKVTVAEQAKQTTGQVVVVVAPGVWVAMLPVTTFRIVQTVVATAV
jgi:hypothetical protein